MALATHPAAAHAAPPTTTEPPARLSRLLWLAITAKIEYDAARQEGKTAALLEQHLPNAFQMLMHRLTALWQYKPV